MDATEALAQIARPHDSLDAAAVADYLGRFVMTRPAVEWTAAEIEVCKSWLALPSVKNWITVSLRLRFRKLFNDALPADIASEGFSEGYARFFERGRVLRYDPTRFPQHEDKLKLFWVFFRTCALRSAIDYFEKQLSRHANVPLDTIAPDRDDEDGRAKLQLVDPNPPPDETLAEGERLTRLRAYLSALLALIEDVRAGADVEPVLAALARGAGADAAARDAGVSPRRVTELRNARVMHILHAHGLDEDDAQHARPVNARVAEAIGVTQDAAKVYVLRARRWTYARIGYPFAE